MGELVIEKNNVVKFNSTRKAKPEKNIPQITIGTIYLDLKINCEHNTIFFTPSYEIEPGLDDQLIDTYKEMLINLFPEAIDQLLELYKNSN